MESNKDDGLKCLKRANEFFRKRSFDEALKYAKKAQRLYPSKEADDLIVRIEAAKVEGPPCADAGDEGVRHRKNSQTTSNGAAYTEHSSSVEPEYTAEQLASVKRIKKCKDYYEILNVSKDATEADLKKSYKKLALKFHPDKNKAPGATEAFKDIGNAYAILSDPSKRRQYDLYGEQEVRQPRRRNGFRGYSHEFEAEVSPEELFNMFFGGNAFTSYHRQMRPRSQQETSHRRQHQGNDSVLSAFFQLSPIIMMIVISLLSIALQGDDVYKFHSSSNYPHQRSTAGLHVHYYVKDGFNQAYSGRSLQKLEREIEQIYINNLRNECYKEQMQREQLRWKARYRNDGKAYEEAGHMEMRSCKRLEEVYG
ncbi:dnaJ homolog subfamily B member 12-like [Watersipora subatra]|uniref:dnaJ homolog subfamily B member 12-like n=1 Tax=Watersipora subatra TaxID=2589382 RepID=UPI00355BD87F